jgi:Flp pilus assembly pilin Flp
VLNSLYRVGSRAIRSFWRDDRGIGTLEIVLIAAVLIMVAILFKDWIIDFIDGLMGKVEGESNKIFS